MDRGAWWATVLGVSKESDTVEQLHNNMLLLTIVTMWSEVKWKSLCHVQLFATPWTSPWNSPGQNTGVGSFSLLQGIFPTQRLNPGLPHCRQILYQLSDQGSPRKLEWVAYPFSRGSSRPRNRTGSPALQTGSLPTDLSCYTLNPMTSLFSNRKFLPFDSLHPFHTTPTPHLRSLYLWV